MRSRIFRRRAEFRRNSRRASPVKARASMTVCSRLSTYNTVLARLCMAPCRAQRQATLCIICLVPPGSSRKAKRRERRREARGAQQCMIIIYSDQSPSRAPSAATRGGFAAARAACVSTWLGEIIINHR